MKSKEKRNFLLGSLILVLAISIGYFGISNVKDTYAVSVCPSGYSLVNSGKSCCPTGYTYKDGYCISDWNKPFSTTYEVSKDSSGNINCTHIYSDTFKLDLPILIEDYGYDKCGCVAGTFNVLTQKCDATCTKNNCGVEATSANKQCFFCTGQASNGEYYQWTTSPSGTCNGGSWTVLSKVTSSANCKASTTTYKCYYCTGQASNGEYYQWTTSPSGTCNGGSWTVLSNVTSSANCKGSTSSCTYDSKSSCESSNVGYNCVLSNGCYVKGSVKTSCTYTSVNACQSANTGYKCTASGSDDYGNTCYIASSKLTYNVVYNANGGSGQPNSQIKNYGEDLTLSSDIPVRDGYTFIGWSANKNATSATYETGDVYTDENSVTLYAIWAPKDAVKYTIVFDANGGSGTTGDVICIKDSDCILTSNGFSKSDFIFDGWNTKSDGSGTSYKDKDVVKNLSTSNGSTVTLYAKWRESVSDDKTDDKTGNKPNDKTDDEITNNSETGNVMMFIAWTIGIGALAYAVYYYKTRIEE